MKAQAITLTFSTCFQASKALGFLEIAFHFSFATCPAAGRLLELGKGSDTILSTCPLNVLVFAIRALDFLGIGFAITLA